MQGETCSERNTDTALEEAATAWIGSVQMYSISASPTVVEITPNSLKMTKGRCNVMDIRD